MVPVSAFFMREIDFAENELIQLRIPLTTLIFDK